MHQVLGIEKGFGNFMVEFPVYIWTEMLVDFRVNVIRHILPHATTFDLPTFWKSITKLFTEPMPFECDEGKVNCGRFWGNMWQPMEYSNLLNFAYHSPKWHDRYEWQVVGDPTFGNYPILSHSAHPRTRGCPVPQYTIRDRDRSSFEQSSARELLYPSELTNNNKRRPRDAERRFIADYTNRFETSGVWLNYVHDRQLALEAYARGRNVSAVEACPGMLAQWRQCFGVVGERTNPGNQMVSMTSLATRLAAGHNVKKDVLGRDLEAHAEMMRQRPPRPPPPPLNR